MHDLRHPCLRAGDDITELGDDSQGGGSGDDGVPSAGQRAAATTDGVRVRVQLIRHLKTCTTDIYIQNECAHVGLSGNAPDGIDQLLAEADEVR